VEENSPVSWPRSSGCVFELLGPSSDELLPVLRAGAIRHL